jgi:hypothetical protein
VARDEVAHVTMIGKVSTSLALGYVTGPYSIVVTNLFSPTTLDERDAGGFNH